MQPVTIYTDGSWLNKHHAGGWSALMVAGPHWRVIYDGVLDTTVNRMELMAVLVGLQQLTEPCVVTIFADSKLTVNIINDWIERWEANGYITSTKQPVANQDLIKQLPPLLKKHRVVAVWVRAHTRRKDTNSLGNAVVDQFAQRAARLTHYHNHNLSYVDAKFPKLKKIMNRTIF